MVTTAPSGLRLVIRRNGRPKSPFGTTPLLPWSGASGINNPDGTVSPYVSFTLKDGNDYQYPLPGTTLSAANTAVQFVVNFPPVPARSLYGGYYFNANWPQFVINKIQD